MFKAIQRADCESLRTLARTFIGIGNDPASLLCLDHVFSSPLKLRSLPLAEVQASLSLYVDYVCLLNKLQHGESLADVSNRQRLFGFQVLGGNRYLVPENTPLHGKLTSRSDSGGKSVGGYKCGYDEIRRGITQLISSRIDDRTEIQNNACRDIHGFSPCLRFLVQKKCNPQKGKEPCTFQHIQPEQLTVDWYHTRLRLILLQFQILYSARCYKLDVKKYVPTRSPRNAWILIKHEVTGLGYCIRHFTRLFRSSDRLQILTLPAYRRELTASRLHENGLKRSALNSGGTPRNPWIATGDCSWLRARWPSTLIEKTLRITFLVCRCIG